jgi:acetylornithine deacetylase/succinyl-diaminopimelate desuccinylase-like protein
VRGDNLFARGASDDKGQTYILFKAVGSLLRDTGRFAREYQIPDQRREETTSAPTSPESQFATRRRV